MKKTTYLIFVCYLLFFGGAGVIFYFKYLDNFLSLASNANPIEAETLSSKSLIYYTQKDMLYRFDPQVETNTLEVSKIEKFQAAGEIYHLDLEKTNSQIAFDTKNNAGLWEIWRRGTTEVKNEKLASNGKNPKFSPDKTKLAFIGLGQSDVIFVQNLATGLFIKLGEEIAAKITDFTWNEDSSKIIFCSDGLLKNGCFEADLEYQKNKELFEDEVQKIVSEQDKLFYLTKGDLPHLYIISSVENEKKQIDNLERPKKITNFQISPKKEKIAYEVKENEKSDVYLSNIDGTDRLQLSADGRASQPVFSRDGTEIAFLRQNDGIYLMTTEKTNEKKLINLSDSINFLLLWK